MFACVYSCVYVCSCVCVFERRRNDLERTFLEMLDFNIDVDSSVYAKYYFELRALAEKFDKDFPLKPLDKDQAEHMEVCMCVRACLSLSVCVPPPASSMACLAHLYSLTATCRCAQALSERTHDLIKGVRLRGAQSLDPEEFRAKAIIS